MQPRFIDAWDSLPRPTATHLQERLWFDVKETYAPKSQPEMAKDIAAFANAVGGALIIGATEGPTAPDYSKALAASYAASVEKEVDEAVRDFCRPSPTVHVRTIPVPTDDTRVIIVINVEPAVDQPVAARHPTDKDMWRFPRRVGRHTEYILPEQLPLFMDSKARRAKLLLLRVLGAGGEIDLFTVPRGASKHANIEGSSRFTVEAVDREGGGSVVLRDSTGALGGQSVAIPLDDVEAVWLQHTGLWATRIAGRLEELMPNDGSATHLIYTPPTTFVVSPLGRVADDLSKHVRDVVRALRGTLAVQHHARGEPRDEEIADRAYQRWRWRAEHNLPGSAEEDWVQARRELLAARREG